MTDVLLLVLGLALAAGGGEVFVRGLLALSATLRIAPAIAGATIAAFATSSPELSVSSIAAWQGRPEFGFGDALGSNVVNLGLVLGLALLASAIHAPRETVMRDFAVALAVPALTGLLIGDGVLSALDGGGLLVAFAAWLIVTIRVARQQRSVGPTTADGKSLSLTLGLCGVGLVLLLAAGRLIVVGGEGIGARLGLEAFVVGATLVAVGTSVPELATVLVAALRRHPEVGLGTLLGSSIFNGLLIVGVAAVIHPIAVDWRQAAVGLAAGAVVVLLSLPDRSGTIARWRGVPLLLAYAGYVAALLAAGPMVQ